ncbi:LysR substrate-binding domain-containing protein [Ruegeria sp.]|uniref:LysR substrate-binding domain-containing protein n=1 Tax=Ruegeria sp. TaxID=1879320 RepID=UPI003B00B0EB
MITYAPYLSPAYASVPLASESLYAVGTKEVLGPVSTPSQLSEVGQMALLTPHKGNYRKLLKSSLSAQGIPMKIARELETAEGLLAFTAEGDGVAILPMSNVYQEYERGEVMVRPIVSPEIERILALYPSLTMSRHTLDVVLPIVRESILKVAQLADWKKVRKNGLVA